MIEKTKLVLDVATNRVIYYTADYSIELVLTTDVVTYDYTKELPKNMSLYNCWNYMLQGQTLRNTEEPAKQPKQTELDFNKKQFVNHVTTVIERLKHEIIGSLNYNEQRYQESMGAGTNNLILTNYANHMGIDLHEAIEQTNSQYKKYKLISRNLDFLKEQYITRSVIVKTNNQLGLIRDQFNKRKSLQNLNRPEYGRTIEEITDLSLANVVPILDDAMRDCQDSELWGCTDTLSNEHVDLILHDYALSKNAELVCTKTLIIKPNQFTDPSTNLTDLYLDKYMYLLSGDCLLVCNEDESLRVKQNKLVWFDDKLEHYIINLTDKPAKILLFDLKPVDPNYQKSKFGAAKLVNS